MNKLSIVLCSLNSKYIHSSLAVWYIAAGIKEYSKLPHKVEVIEGSINQDVNTIAEQIISHKPKIVGLSCYIWNITKIKQLAKMIKSSLNDCIIVLGGPEVSFNAKDVLEQNPFVDYIISGEGEYPFAVLSDCIAEGKACNAEGICTRDRISQPYISKSQPPSPYTDDYYNSLNGRISYFESSRGCPFSCSFCLSSRCTGVQFFDLEYVKKELLRLANSGTKTIKFVDRTFNANKKHAKNIIKFITDSYKKEIPEGVCFHFEIAGDILDEEIISMLINAPKGCFQLEIGMQSFNEKTLEAINRKTNCKILINNIKKLIKSRNMHIHIDLIAGLPFEDLDSFKNSFDTAYYLNADMLQLGFLKILHGTDLEKQAKDFSIVYNENPPYEVISTEFLSNKDILLLKKVEDAVDRAYNSGRFRKTIDYCVSCGIKPFDVFVQISNTIDCSQGYSLNQYTEKVYNALSDLTEIDKIELRDTMVCDILSSIHGGKIPPILQIEDKNLKKVKRYFADKTSGMFSVAILYSKKLIAYVDYQKSQDKYQIEYYTISEIE